MTLYWYFHVIRGQVSLSGIICVFACTGMTVFVPYHFEFCISLRGMVRIRG